MRLLIDTQAVIWYVDQDHLLSTAAHPASKRQPPSPAYSFHAPPGAPRPASSLRPSLGSVM
jgi:hypothetical protein